MSAPGCTLLSLARDELLVRCLYRSAHLIPAARISDAGAMSLNAWWEADPRDKGWFIEMQRFGAELVQAGVVCDEPAWITRGLQIVAWGFARQGPRGDFPGTGDPYHSTELFIEGAARCWLLLQQGGLLDLYPAAGDGFPARIHAAAAWITSPEIARAGRAGNVPFVHRCWIMAAALGEAAAVTGDRGLETAAGWHADEGLRQQAANGVNAERGGFDVNYQSAGLLMAARYFAVGTDASLRGRTVRMLQIGLDWLLDRIGPGGEVRAEGSTRTGKEILRSGAVKTPNEWELAQTFCYGATITGNERCRDAARRVVAAKGGALRPDQLL